VQVRSNSCPCNPGGRSAAQTGPGGQSCIHGPATIRQRLWQQLPHGCQIEIVSHLPCAFAVCTPHNVSYCRVMHVTPYHAAWLAALLPGRLEALLAPGVAQVRDQRRHWIMATALVGRGGSRSLRCGQPGLPPLSAAAGGVRRACVAAAGQQQQQRCSDQAQSADVHARPGRPAAHPHHGGLGSCGLASWRQAGGAPGRDCRRGRRRPQQQHRR